LKILIIAAPDDEVGGVATVMQESRHEVERVTSAIEGNDVILTGLATGRPYQMIVLHHNRDSQDTRELIRYWRSQDPFLPLVTIGGGGKGPDEELIDMGLLDQIPEDAAPALIRNRFQLIQQSMAIGNTYRLKAELLQGPAVLSDPSKAVDRALDLIRERLRVQAASFVAYTAFEDEPIIQIVKGVEAFDQLWLDEICGHAARDIEPILVSGRMTFESTDPARYIYPITTARGWEGLLIFFIRDEEREEMSSALAGQLSTVADGLEAMLGHVRTRLELQQTRAGKSEYLDIMSDRIRQPISDLMSTTEVLMMVETQEPIRGLVVKMAEQARMSAGMLDDIIELGRIDDGMLIIHPRRMSMKKLVLRVVEKLDLLFLGKNIDLQLRLDDQQDYPVEGDPDKLKKVFAHLLSNAVRFSPQGATIVIELETKEDGWVCTSIRDEGRGLTPEQQAHVFERTAGHDLSISETGIGLYLCRKFVTAHEGKIWFESAPGLGTTFYVLIRPGVMPTKADQ